MKSALIGVALIASAAAIPSAWAESAHWGYEGEIAAEHWAELSPEFAACSAGKNQSPIDITGEVHATALPKLGFDYRTPVVSVVNNGHTIQANFAPGSTVTLAGHAYELKQMHFHVPSENEIHGKHFAMEGHLVHQDKEGHLAVVAVMFKEGRAQSALASLWKQMPEQADGEHPFEGRLTAAQLLPKKHDYYYFSGSLTTPPCSEGVSWIVLKEPVDGSKAQVEQFAHTMHHPNNRPVQARNARIVIN